MKHFLSLLLLLIISPLTVLSQTIRGVITETSGEPIPYANIAVYNDSIFILPATADSCGAFSTQIGAIKYPRLRISMIGYETLDTLFTLTDSPVSIVLNHSSISLNEVEVRHTPPTVVMKGDVLVANVFGTALQSIGSAKDVLRHVPLISLSNNDGIEVFGRGTPAVYINGRRVTDMRELNQLRSENIKSIDVITNPGAGYSADIMAVVKIRTMKQRGEGISALAGISESYDSHFSNAGDINIKYRRNKLELFAEGSYSVGCHAYKTGNDQWSPYEDDRTLRQDAISDRIADMTWGARKTGLSYNFTQEHSTIIVTGANTKRFIIYKIFL